MHNNGNILFGLCVLIAIVASGCQTVEVSARITPTPTLQDPHHHIGNANNNSLGPQNINGLEIVEVSISSDVTREQVATSQDGTLNAFTTCSKTCEILFEEIKTGRTYEIQAPSFSPARPFSNPVWIASNILIFDQWSQPHYGVHYAVDVVNKKLLLASPVTDQMP
jgi:hypothetical protein